MENASKALLMAGGILIALLVIDALLLMVNQVGDYQRSQNANKKDSQLAEFNLDFERYCDNKGIKGADIVSLINKINDYNNKSIDNAVNNSVDYDIKMSVTVSGFDKFNNKYAYGNSSSALFRSTPPYKFDTSNRASNDLYNELQKCANAVSTSGNRDKLKILSAAYDITERDSQKNIEIIKKKCEEINFDWNPDQITLDTIKNYRQYTEFMSSTFKVEKDPVYQNGQIKDLYFIFDK